MNHEAAREKLLDLAYGELSPREAAEVEAHLAGCEACRGERDRIAATRAAMRRLEPAPAPERGEAVLLAAAREAAARRGAGRRPLLAPWAWRLSAAAVLAAAVGLVSFQVLSLRERRVRAELGEVPVPAPAAAASPARTAPRERAAPPPAPRAEPERAVEPPRAAPGRLAAEAAGPPAEARAARPSLLGPVRALVDAVDRDLAAGKLSESTRRFEPCAPDEDVERRLYRDAGGRPVKYVRISGPAAAGRALEQYYDAAGRLRCALVRDVAPGGSRVERRVWLGESGERLDESEAARGGPGYPLPAWPGRDLALRDPAAAFRAAARCPEIGAGGAR